MSSASNISQIYQAEELKSYLQMMACPNLMGRINFLIEKITGAKLQPPYPKKDQAKALGELIRKEIENNGKLSDNEKKYLLKILEMSVDESLFRNERIIIFMACELSKDREHAKIDALFLLSEVTKMVERHKIVRTGEMKVEYDSDNLVAEVTGRH